MLMRRWWWPVLGRGLPSAPTIPAGHTPIPLSLKITLNFRLCGLAVFGENDIGLGSFGRGLAVEFWDFLLCLLEIIVQQQFS